MYIVDMLYTPKINEIKNFEKKNLKNLFYRIIYWTAVSKKTICSLNFNRDTELNTLVKPH